MSYLPPAAGTFTPTVTVAGGTVPTYTTNTGRYTRVGNRVVVEVLLTGNGGTPGSGGTSFTIALPFTASASSPAGIFPCGAYRNNSMNMGCFGEISGAVAVVTLTDGTFMLMTGDDQNATDRQIRLQFAYEV